MDNIWNEIEKSTRTIFRIFFDSKLYKSRVAGNNNRNLKGVNLLMDFNGPKRFSILFEEDTVKSVMEKLIGEDVLFEEGIAFDVLREMASIIACGAYKEDYIGINISNPVISYDLKSIEGAVNFSSKLGKFAIAIEDV